MSDIEKIEDDELLADISEVAGSKKEEEENFTTIMNEIKDGPAVDMMNSGHEDFPNMLGSIVGRLGGAMSRAINKGEGSSESILESMFGKDLADEINRKVAVKTFFEEVLVRSSMKEAIKETKAEFDLPDDYVMQLKIKVTFSTNDEKVIGPEID